MSAARVGLRSFTNNSRSTGFTFRNSNSVFRQTWRRQQTTASGPAIEPAPPQSILQRLWNSPVGVKTVHFWAPVMKWGVVLAGVGDFFRPAEKLSLTQNLALVATGSIWTRWCFVIRPQNMLLAGVNFALFIVGTVQVGRILTLKKEEDGSLEAAAKDLAKDIKGQAKGVANTAQKELS